MSVLKQRSRGRLFWRSALVYLQLKNTKWMTCKKQIITPQHTIRWINKRFRHIRPSNYRLNPPSQPLLQPEERPKWSRATAHSTSRARKWRLCRQRSAPSTARPATWAYSTIKRRIIEYRLWPFQLSILKILLALSISQSKHSKSIEMVAQEMNRMSMKIRTVESPRIRRKAASK